MGNINRYHGHLLLDIELLPCPFCDSSPHITQIGNNVTKKRSVIIKCKKCGVQMKTSALIFDVEWCQKDVSKKWNQRKR